MTDTLLHYSAIAPTPACARVREGGGGVAAPSRTIEGMAIVFGQRSQPYHMSDDSVMYEVIEPEALTQELLDRSDIRMTINHDRGRLLARSRRGAGTLDYTIAPDGVHFAFDAPDTPDGQTALELVRRGDIRACSFMFAVDTADPGAVELVRCADVDGVHVTEAHIRRIAAVYDFALVDVPAYEGTEAHARALAEAYTVTPETSTLNPQQTEMDEPNLNSDGTLAVQSAAAPSLTTMVRDALRTSRHADIVLTRAEGGDPTPTTPGTPGTTGATVDTAAAAPVIPLRVQDIIHDVEEGLVYEQIGIPLTHSNSGEFVWPSYTAGSCQIVGEKEAVAPAELNFSRIKAKPERFSAEYDVSWQALNQTDGIVETVVRRALALAMQRGINTLLLSTSKVKGAAEIQGPLVAASAAGKVVTLSKAPTYKELMGMKAQLLATGYATAPVWVMSAASACDLEAQPRDAGSGIMCIEGGKLCGYPVFVSHVLTDSYIALGDWSYQPSGFFGEVRLIVDPYTEAGRDMVRFILNFDFATATVRPDAFVVGKKS